MAVGEAVAFGIAWICIAIAGGIGWTAYLCGVALATALEKATITIVWHRRAPTLPDDDSNNLCGTSERTE